MSRKPRYWQKERLVVNGRELLFSHRQAQILLALYLKPHTHAELWQMIYGPGYNRSIVSVNINHLNQRLGCCDARITSAYRGPYQLQSTKGMPCSVQSATPK